MRVVLAACFVTTVLSLTVPACADDPLPRGKPEDAGMSAARLADIGKLLRADVDRGRLPGAVIAIARHGKLVHFEAIGFRDKVAGAPMTTDAIFSIASMTKPMVATAALQLTEQGRLQIDDPLSKYFPKFANAQVAIMDDKGQSITGTVPTARKITIQDLPRHTSGLIYGGRGATAVHKLYPSSSSDASRDMTGAEFLDKLASVPLMYQPGAVWDYGFGLDVLGLVIEQITEHSLGRALNESIWAPLGMTDTSFVVPADKVGRYARSLPNDPDTGQPQSRADATKPAKFECGGGCAVSTASDYMRFAQMLLNKGSLNGTRVLGRKTVEYMVANQLGPEVKNRIFVADPTRADFGFGYGLAVQTTPGIVRTLGSVGTFSWPGASGTNWWTDPKEDLVVVFMSAAPGPIRWHYRQVINAMVYAAITD